VERGAVDSSRQDWEESPLEWVAATGIYVTHVADNIERNKSNLRM
jgi:hypothetical protein